VSLYVVQDGQLIDQQYNGRSGVAEGQRLPASYHYLEVGVAPGKEQELYFQVFFNDDAPAQHYTHLFMVPFMPTVNTLINRLVWQAFYAGILLMLCVVSLVVYRLFSERVFLYFAGMMFSCALYFSDRYGVMGLITEISYPNDRFSLMLFAIAGIVVFTSLFVSAFVQMGTYMKAYSRFYKWVWIVIVILPYIMMLFSEHLDTTRAIYDALLIVWVLLTVWPVAWLAWQGRSGARSLVPPFAILFLGVGVFLLRQLPFFDGNYLAGYGFQIGLLLFSAILFIVLFERVDTLRKKKQQFEELNELKSRFFTNLSHEFRTPLTLMMGPLQQLMESKRSQEEQQLLGIAYQNANNQLQLVNELLELSKLEAGKMALKASEQDALPFLKGLVYAFESLAAQRGVELAFQSDLHSLTLYFDASKLEKVINNLLSNAFKFTPEGGAISVRLSTMGKEACIAVADTGPGIPLDQQERIFDRFFQSDEYQSMGSGVGLALVKELVKLHYGRVTLDSEPGKGTVFKVYLPLGQNHLSEGERVKVPEHYARTPSNGAMSKVVLDRQHNIADAPRVLLVEDNAEVRAFVKQRLAVNFQVMEAADGQEGIDKALEEMPDLIVSDVMMPQKNGYELCSTLKHDVRTSHIPIILLTAKAEQEEKLQGLRTGADDYLAKPFDAEELYIRIRNLIQIRQQLRERFATAVELKPREVSANSIDQEFLEKALQIVESNLGNEQFKVEALAQEIGMSRPNLNRKLRALINQSTNQFIQSIRLQRAADLLQQQSGTVAEIALETGFSSTAYFIKCFKDKYGETPGNFAKS
jgi:signal transduction histidine kinase/DNA-binding response OmpR family regulator